MPGKKSNEIQIEKIKTSGSGWDLSVFREKSPKAKLASLSMFTYSWLDEYEEWVRKFKDSTSGGKLIERLQYEVGLEKGKIKESDEDYKHNYPVLEREVLKTCFLAKRYSAKNNASIKEANSASKQLKYDTSMAKKSIPDILKFSERYPALIHSLMEGWKSYQYISQGLNKGPSTIPSKLYAPNFPAENLTKLFDNFLMYFQFELNGLSRNSSIGKDSRLVGPLIYSSPLPRSATRDSASNGLLINMLYLLTHYQNPLVPQEELPRDKIPQQIALPGRVRRFPKGRKRHHELALDFVLTTLPFEKCSINISKSKDPHKEGRKRISYLLNKQKARLTFWPDEFPAH
ncbi:MAG: hypothetical protein COV66_07550 [Nitrospinae bacterium CG11_big_fil_rev_8_21_14_0_20_45_15]|nr:MAG: hypothetical protein COV66_07550 [Nitrospinae bacterium CG11_big_fil_rev_8_21_14_0_20_45_15]